MLTTHNVSLGVLIGSLRRDSLNRKVFETIMQRASVGVDIFELPIRHLSFYNEDLDTEDPPREVTGFREALTVADGVLFLTPEYNHSIPAVLKNAID